MFIVTLPAPPPGNALFVHARNKGRVRSAEYLSWLGKAALIIDATRAGTSVAVVPPVAVTVSAGRGNEARDLSNLIRPAQDLIVRCGVIPGDSAAFVRRCVAEDAAGDVPDGWVRIVVEGLD